MTDFLGCFLTNKGKAIVEKMGTNHINFTKAATGSGLYATETEVKTLTALKDQKQEFEITNFSTLASGDVDVLFYIKNLGLTEDYQLREIGLFAQDDSGVEVLYCVAIALSSASAETIPAYDNIRDYTAKIDVVTAVSTDAIVNVIFHSEDHEWTAGYVKSITGEVDIEKDGTLQEQINNIKESGAGKVDDKLSKLSTNPVQNKVITEKLETMETAMGGLKFGVNGDGCLTVTYDDGQ